MRTWAALTSMYDNNFVSTATGEALSRLGEELGIPRPFLEAKGTIRLTLTGTLPTGISELSIPRGSRLLTSGGHHVSIDESTVFSSASPERDVAVVAFYPGPEHNLNPTRAAADGTFPEKIDRWNRDDRNLDELFQAESLAGASLLQIAHTASLTGGEFQWDDNRYRQLLLQAPRSLWTVEAIQTAVFLIPGVRQVQVRDGLGGLDLSQSIFSNFNFMDRLFSSERDLGSPYYFTVLVAPTPAAIWEGPSGLAVTIESAIEDLRPISIFPKITRASEIGIGVRAQLIVQGLSLPTGQRAVVNSSQSAIALKQRLISRLQRYIDTLSFGEPIRASEIIWAFMSEPGIVDIVNLELLRYPPGFDSVDFRQAALGNQPEVFDRGKNISLQSSEIPVLIDDPSQLAIL
jgi:hypothetical protein